MDLVMKCGLIWVVSSLLVELLKSGIPNKGTYSSPEELIKIYPHLQSVEVKRRRITLIQIVTAAFAVAISVYLCIKNSNNNMLAVVFFVATFSGMVDGFVSLSSSVYITGYKNAIKYFYDENTEYVNIAKYSILIFLISAFWIAWILVAFIRTEP